MTKEEEMKLRELAAGRCTLPSVTEALGPLSLWSKDGLDREIRKAVEAEREACAMLCLWHNNTMSQNPTLFHMAELIRERA